MLGHSCINQNFTISTTLKGILKISWWKSISKHLHDIYTTELKFSKLKLFKDNTVTGVINSARLDK